MRAVAVYVVRHGCAGRRGSWSGDDLERPLDAVGRTQSEFLGRLLSRVRPSLVVSSPARRCIQTVEPLAQATGLEVTTSARLGPDAGEWYLLGLMTGGPHGTVVGVHGEAMAKALAWVRRYGQVVDDDEDDTSWLAKGGVWRATLRPHGTCRLERYTAITPAVGRHANRFPVNR